MKKVLIILLSIITAFAVWFGVSYACKGVAKSWVDTWKGNNQIEEPEEPGDVVTPEEPNEPEEPGDVVTPEEPNEPEEPGDVVEPEQPEEHVHAFKTVLSFDDTYHFYVCEDETCNEVKDKAEHVYTWVIDTPATTFVAGVKHEECECGSVRNENTVIEELGLVSQLNFNDVREFSYTNSQSSANMQFETFAYPDNSLENEFYTSIFGLDFVLDESNVNFFTFGSSFRVGGDTRLMLRYSASSAAQASFDIMIGGERYRLMNEDVTNLVLDVLENKTLSLEVGSTKFNDVVYFGFKFTSQNYELSYTTLDNGSLTKDTNMFECSSGSSATSGEETTIHSLLESADDTVIEDAMSYGISAIYFASYADAEAVTTINVNDTSSWFNNVVKTATTEAGHNYIEDTFTE